MILHLISSLSRGGRERQLANIVSNTNQDKYPSRIVYFNDRKNSYFEEYKLQDISIKVKSASYLTRLIELNRILTNNSPDLVYAWGNIESSFAIILAAFHKYKFINGSIRHGIRSKKLSHFLRTLVLKISRNIVANSYAGLKANNLKKGKVLYNGIDERFIGVYEPELRNKKRIELLGIEQHEIIVISVANLIPYKDYYSVLKMLKQIKEENYAFKYLILGDGPMRTDILRTINEYNLTENVSIIGHVENVSDYLKIADIFIHSSKGEGCSNAILEAMAAGLPIIASDTGGTSEIVTKDNGFLFEYKNHIQLANYFKDLLSDKNKARQMGTHSLRIIKARYTIEAMMKNYYCIINDAI